MSNSVGSSNESDRKARRTLETPLEAKAEDGSSSGEGGFDLGDLPFVVHPESADDALGYDAAGENIHIFSHQGLPFIQRCPSFATNPVRTLYVLHQQPQETFRAVIC